MSWFLLLFVTAHANLPTDPVILEKFAGHYQAFDPSPTECRESWPDVYLKSEAVPERLTLGPTADDSPEDFQISSEAMFGLRLDYVEETEVYTLSTPTGCVFRRVR